MEVKSFQDYVKINVDIFMDINGIMLPTCHRNFKVIGQIKTISQKLLFSVYEIK